MEGRMPNTDEVTAVDIDCTISAASPTTNVRLLSFENVTIEGTNLPTDLETNAVRISFNDAQETECIPQLSSTNEIVC
jgi:hypothetical protein